MIPFSGIKFYPCRFQVNFNASQNILPKGFVISGSSEIMFIRFRALTHRTATFLIISFSLVFRLKAQKTIWLQVRMGMLTFVAVEEPIGAYCSPNYNQHVLRFHKLLHHLGLLRRCYFDNVTSLLSFFP